MGVLYSYQNCARYSVRCIWYDAKIDDVALARLFKERWWSLGHVFVWGPVHIKIYRTH